MDKWNILKQHLKEDLESLNEDEDGEVMNCIRTILYQMEDLDILEISNNTHGESESKNG